MAETDYQIESMGQVYAQALVNLAVKQNLLSEITEDVRGIKGVLDSNAKFAQFAASPVIDDDEKIASFTKILSGRVHPLVLETLKSMAHRQRLIYLTGFIAAFEGVLAKLAGRLDVEIISAQQLPPAVIERIRVGVAKSLGSDPQLKVSIDPTLIGGIRLRIEDTLLDGSIETQLQHLREQIEQSGASKLQQKIQAIVTG